MINAERNQFTLRVGDTVYLKGGVIRFDRYRSHEILIEVIQDETSSYCASASLTPYGAPHPGKYGLWLRGWSENEGVPEALATAGIVTLTGLTAANGNVVSQHADLTKRARGIFLQQFYVLRLERAIGVLRELSESDRENFDINVTAVQTGDCFRAGIEGHCGLDPWFIAEGLTTYDKADVGGVSVDVAEFFGTPKPFYRNFYPAQFPDGHENVTVDDAIAALEEAIASLRMTSHSRDAAER